MGTCSVDSQSWRPGLLGTCVENAVLDGEIACVDDSGRPNFRSLLYRQRQCIFIAFDLLYLNGKDLRVLPLLERKAILKKLLRRKRSRILYLDHVESDGRLLFEEIVKMDLEGIVCKRKDSAYKVSEKPSPHWIKIKNPRYHRPKGGKSCSTVLNLQKPTIAISCHMD